MDKSIEFMHYLASAAYLEDFYDETDLLAVNKFNEIFNEYKYPYPVYAKYNEDEEAYEVYYQFTQPVPENLVTEYLKRVKAVINQYDNEDDINTMLRLVLNKWHEYRQSL